MRLRTALADAQLLRRVRYRVPLIAALSCRRGTDAHDAQSCARRAPGVNQDARGHGEARSAFIRAIWRVVAWPMSADRLGDRERYSGSGDREQVRERGRKRHLSGL